MPKTVPTAPTYMAQAEPIQYVDEGLADQMAVRFITASDTRWQDRVEERELFAAIYGQKALKIVQKFNLVPESQYPELVAGTYWDKPKYARRSIWDQDGKVVTQIPDFPEDKSWGAISNVWESWQVRQYLLFLAISTL